MITARAIVFAILACLFAVAATAADISGKWTAEFDTQIGMQKYIYEFKVTGDKITGKASARIGDQDVQSEIKEGKITGDDVTFVETMNFGGMELRIEYRGKIAGDEMKLTRKVADVAEEQLVAKRAK